MRRHEVGITAVGRDRGGVIAAFTNAVFESGGNIERMSQNVIKGLFGMHIRASFPRGVDAGALDAAVGRIGAETGMDVDTHHETGRPKNVAVFVTREPGCLEAILGARRTLGGRVALIVGTDGALRPLAKRHGIPFVLAGGRDQQASERKMLAACKKADIGLIALARYMRILTPNFVWRYPERIINIHPSLLPAFPGALAYEQAHERGAKVAGVTAHYVTESLDQGPIILQEPFKVDPGDTLEQVKGRGQRLEARVLLRAVRLHLAGRLDVRWRRVHVRGR
ncbi:MAG: formyltetrahydrofolate deformylase [Nitrosopumilus sp.]|nr:formyltetrahydrofolate deformylase [Nitrosopumilus sp.]CAI9830739.1 Formyl transferase domain-containing protein [Nitrosopumilaceae archaeon]MDA7941950.1 formyltetrahydrofolate deformylase [Nitrosopumilus sp.]MDA7943903.1 formyltetrahydrofolate deformylase [Nitrosopumilus sp.]MDA7945261.1 formyltetrahydrofolate deformylase [Nitrosopumilus sp.]